MWTKELLLKQLEKSDKSTTWSIIRLWEQQAFTESDTEILSSFAEQAVWRLREIERGDRSADCPLLSTKQLELARLRLRKYWRILLDVANSRRPERAEQVAVTYRMNWRSPDPVTCWRCGEESVCRYDHVSLCRHCVPIYERIRRAYPYELSKSDKERLHEELGPLDAGRTTTDRVETEALVIQGRNIRFKTAREFAAQYAEERHGMPRSLAEALADMNRNHNPDMSTAELFEEDPFDFE
jgi:hypothetical protein